MDKYYSARLPGADEYIAKHPQIHEWLNGHRSRMDQAFAEGHEPAFDRGLFSYIEGLERVNELLAEEYAERVTDPEQWELRYIRWMKKIRCIVFNSAKWGEFSMYRVKPRRDPGGLWFTVDEMIDMVDNPLLPSVLEAFDTFPMRPESLPGPKRGEQHLCLTVTPEGVQWKANVGR